MMLTNILLAAEEMTPDDKINQIHDKIMAATCRTVVASTIHKRLVMVVRKGVVWYVIHNRGAVYNETTHPWLAARYYNEAV